MNNNCDKLFSVSTYVIAFLMLITKLLGQLRLKQIYQIACFYRFRE